MLIGSHSSRFSAGGRVAIIDDADYFNAGKRQLPAQDAGGAAAAFALDLDRHKPQPAVTDDSLAIADRAVSRRWPSDVVGERY